jgi:hypothetical protein
VAGDTSDGLPGEAGADDQARGDAPGEPEAGAADEARGSGTVGDACDGAPGDAGADAGAGAGDQAGGELQAGRADNAREGGDDETRGGAVDGAAGGISEGERVLGAGCVGAALPDSDVSERARRGLNRSRTEPMMPGPFF